MKIVTKRDFTGICIFVWMVENFCQKHQLFHKIGKLHAPSPITKDTKVTDELAQQGRGRPGP